MTAQPKSIFKWREPMDDNVIHYGDVKQINQADLIPVANMWIHVCPANPHALMGIGEGERCNRCGADETDRLDRKVTHDQ